ncbi:Protein BREAST CANCER SUSCEPTIBILITY 2-like protein B, partial [Diplonema papillatum]
QQQQQQQGTAARRARAPTAEADSLDLSESSSGLAHSAGGDAKDAAGQKPPQPAANPPRQKARSRPPVSKLYSRKPVAAPKAGSSNPSRDSSRPSSEASASAGLAIERPTSAATPAEEGRQLTADVTSPAAAGLGLNAAGGGPLETSFDGSAKQAGVLATGSDEPVGGDALRNGPLPPALYDGARRPISSESSGLRTDGSPLGQPGDANAAGVSVHDGAMTESGHPAGPGIEPDPSNEGAQPPGVPAAASGNRGRVGDDALHLGHLSGTEGNPPPNLEVLPAGVLTTGSGKRIEVGGEALKKSRALLGLDDPTDTGHSSPGVESLPPAGVLTTGSGKRVEVGGEALKQSRKLLGVDEQEIERALVNEMPPPGILTTGSGNSVGVGEDALKQSRTLLGLDVPTAETDHESAGELPPPGMLTTGSGKRVKVGADALQKSRKLLGSGKRVKVGEDALQKSRKLLGLDDQSTETERENSKDDLPPPGMLTTGSGKRVKVGEDALQKSRKLLGLDDQTEAETNRDEALQRSREAEESPPRVDKHGGGKPSEAKKRPISAAADEPAAKRKVLHKNAFRIPTARQGAGRDADWEEAEDGTPDAAAANHHTSPLQRRPAGGAGSKFSKRKFNAPRLTHSGSVEPGTPSYSHPSHSTPPDLPKRPKTLSPLVITDAGFPVKAPSASSCQNTPVPRHHPPPPYFHVTSGDDVVLPCNEGLASCESSHLRRLLFDAEPAGSPAGPLQFRRMLLALGAVETHASLEWVLNHLRLLALKLSAYEQNGLPPPPRYSRHLVADVVAAHLLYRYNHEYVQGHRSALTQLYNKDATATGRGLVLKIVGNPHYGGAPADGPVVLDVSDGWYTMTASLDKPLLDRLPVLTVGTVLFTFSPDLNLANPVAPLEGMASETARNGILRLHFNSTRPLKPECLAGPLRAHAPRLGGGDKPPARLRLGFAPRGLIPFARVACIHPDGGPIAAVEAVVHRGFPACVGETLRESVPAVKDADGEAEMSKRHVRRSEASERIAEREWGIKCEKLHAAALANAEKTMESERKQRRTSSKASDGEESASHEEFQRALETELKRGEFAAINRPRDTLVWRQFLIGDLWAKPATAVLKLCAPPADALSTLQEGSIVHLFSTVPSKYQPTQYRAGHAKLALSSVRHRFLTTKPPRPITPGPTAPFTPKPPPQHPSLTTYEPRKVLSSRQLQYLHDRGLFDFVGVVVGVGRRLNTNTVAPSVADSSAASGMGHESVVYLCDPDGVGNDSVVLRVSSVPATRTQECALIGNGSLALGDIVGVMNVAYTGWQEVPCKESTRGRTPALLLHNGLADEWSVLKANLSGQQRSSGPGGVGPDGYCTAHLREAAAREAVQKLSKDTSYLRAACDRLSSLPQFLGAPQRGSGSPPPGQGAPAASPARQAAPFSPRPPPFPATPTRWAAGYPSPPATAARGEGAPVPPPALYPRDPQTPGRQSAYAASPAPATVIASQYSSSSNSPQPACTPGPAPFQTPGNRVPAETKIHVFGHFMVPWVLAFERGTLVLGVEEGRTVPPALDSAAPSAAPVLRSIFWDGWGDAVSVAVEAPAARQLFFPDTGVNQAQGAVLKRFLEDKTEGDFGDARVGILHEAFGRAPWSADLIARRLLFALSRSIVVPSLDAARPPESVPFSQRDWAAFTGALTSFSRLFVKATLVQRTAGSLPRSEPPGWKTDKVFVLTDKVHARDLYN